MGDYLGDNRPEQPRTTTDASAPDHPGRRSEAYWISTYEYCLTDTDTTILTGAGQDLENYHGDKLADDGEQYYQDEQSYNPSGPVDTSYASALVTDIGALEKDCPNALKEALKIDNRS